MGRKQPENAAEWLERYESRYEKAYRNYQETGDPKYDRQIWEYGCVCEGFKALVEKKSDRSEEIKKRCRNRDWVLDRMTKPTYTREEVKKMLYEAVYW